jgi:hypothetical protein
MAWISFTLAVGLLASAAVPEERACPFKDNEIVTVRGVIRFVRSETTPIMRPDASADYSIVQTTDVYLLSPTEICSRSPIVVRFVYGHVRAASCSDGAAAEITGAYESGFPPSITVLSPPGLVCSAPR